MRTIEIPVPEAADCGLVECAIDAAIRQVGLRVTLRSSLKKYPGCVHWHAKKGRDAGTLEITLWPQERRAWFTIRSARSAGWIEEALEALNASVWAFVSEDGLLRRGYPIGGPGASDV